MCFSVPGLEGKTPICEALIEHREMMIEELQLLYALPVDPKVKEAKVLGSGVFLLGILLSFLKYG